MIYSFMRCLTCICVKVTEVKLNMLRNLSVCVVFTGVRLNVLRKPVCMDIVATGVRLNILRKPFVCVCKGP